MYAFILVRVCTCPCSIISRARERCMFTTCAPLILSVVEFVSMRSCVYERVWNAVVVFV